MSDEKNPQELDPQIDELPAQGVSGDDAEQVKGGLLPAVNQALKSDMSVIGANKIAPGADSAFKFFKP